MSHSLQNDFNKWQSFIIFFDFIFQVHSCFFVFILVRSCLFLFDPVGKFQGTLVNHCHNLFGSFRVQASTTFNTIPKCTFQTHNICSQGIHFFEGKKDQNKGQTFVYDIRDAKCVSCGCHWVKLVIWVATWVAVWVATLGPGSVLLPTTIPYVDWKKNILDFINRYLYWV